MVGNMGETIGFGEAESKSSDFMSSEVDEGLELGHAVVSPATDPSSTAGEHNQATVSPYDIVDVPPLNR